MRAATVNHAPSGPVMVRLTGDSSWICLEVEDHGPGIPADELPRIWESFSRGELVRSSPNRGSGLSLAVVRQLTELHGGRVEATSELGQGTTLRIWLPTARPSQPIVQPELECPENVASGLDLKGIRA